MTRIAAPAAAALQVGCASGRRLRSTIQFMKDGEGMA
jgi:hypothetical protein